jgi:hypothetical protein
MDRKGNGNREKCQENTEKEEEKRRKEYWFFNNAVSAAHIL